MRRRELLVGAVRGAVGLWLARILPARAGAPTVRAERRPPAKATGGSLEVSADGGETWTVVARETEYGWQPSPPEHRNCRCVLTIPWHIASDNERQFLPEVRNA